MVCNTSHSWSLFKYGVYPSRGTCTNGDGWLQWLPWCLSIVKVLDFLTSKFSYTQQEYDSNLLCVLFLSLPLDSLPPKLNQTHGIPATSRETKAITKYSAVWSRFGSFSVVTFSCRYPRRAVSHKTSIARFTVKPCVWNVLTTMNICFMVYGLCKPHK